ncbi:MAG: glycerol kinase, partial [Firmicutes bacterium]|nr:glycerol kinase [Bacillota bacterium]
MDYLLAVDVGTSSCRTVLYTKELEEIAWASEQYDLLTPKPGCAEQDPHTI